jgi:ABC-type amino acid transport system permease subunit
MSSSDVHPRTALWDRYHGELIAILLLVLLAAGWTVLRPALDSVFQALFTTAFDPDTARRLAEGLTGTLLISFGAITVGTPVGFGLAYLFRFVQLRASAPLRICSWAVFYAALAMPAYLFIFWSGTYLFPRPDRALIASSALALNLAIFVAKIVYGGFSAVPSGQIEAARASGATGVRLAIDFEIPAVLRAVDAAIAVEWATTLKLSSLVGVIGATDIMQVVMEQDLRTYHSGVYVIVFAVYWVLITPILLWSDRRSRDG